MIPDAQNIYFANFDEFAREIDVYNIPAVREFVNKYETADNEAELNNALSEAADRAFVAGFDTALKLVTGIPVIVGDKVVGALDADLLKLFSCLNVRQRHELVRVALNMETEVK
jgi:hypothetical protein